MFAKSKTLFAVNSIYYEMFHNLSTKFSFTPIKNQTLSKRHKTDGGESQHLF